MIDRRRVIHFAIAALAGAALFQSPAARADQAFQRFFPLLIDLDGWDGKKPDGASIAVANYSMITATRAYQRGAARFNAGIIIGPAAQAALATTRMAMDIETGEGHMITSTLDGLAVTKTYNNDQKSGAILVALGTAAMLGFSYNGLSEDDALALAQKFDWKAITAAALQK